MKQELSAFPLTPLHNNQVDLHAFSKLLKRLTNAQVDSIGILGSTGCYPYLDRATKQKVIQMAVEQSHDIPVMVGVGSLNTYDVLTNVEDAQKLGTSSIMLAPVSYHKLTEDDVFSLFKDVSKETSIPICIYDNPGTTNFIFTDELYARITALPNISAIKIPAIAKDIEISQQRITQIKSIVPSHIKIGVSSDSTGAWGMLAGADIWFSATAGLFPILIQNIFRATQQSKAQEAIQLSEQLNPLWELIAQYKGSVRCVAAMAEILELVQSPCLPKPIQPMNSEVKEQLKKFMQSLDLS